MSIDDFLAGGFLEAAPAAAKARRGAAALPDDEDSSGELLCRVVVWGGFGGWKL